MSSAITSYTSSVSVSTDIPTSTGAALKVFFEDWAGPGANRPTPSSFGSGPLKEGDDEYTNQGMNLALVIIGFLLVVSVLLGLGGWLWWSSSQRRKWLAAAAKQDIESKGQAVSKGQVEEEMEMQQVQQVQVTELRDDEVKKRDELKDDNKDEKEDEAKGKGKAEVKDKDQVKDKTEVKVKDKAEGEKVA